MVIRNVTDRAAGVKDDQPPSSRKGRHGLSHALYRQFYDACIGIGRYSSLLPKMKITGSNQEHFHYPSPVFHTCAKNISQFKPLYFACFLAKTYPREKTAPKNKKFKHTKQLPFSDHPPNLPTWSRTLFSRVPLQRLPNGLSTSQAVCEKSIM
jgi:hypothetical protein